MHMVRRAGQRSTACWNQCVDTGLSAVQYAILVVLKEEQSCDQQRWAAAPVSTRPPVRM